MRLAGYVLALGTTPSPTLHDADAQADALRTWSRESGHTLLRLYRDGADAARLPLAARPGGEPLWNDLSLGRVNGLLVQRADLLLPTAGERLAGLVNLLPHLGITLLTLDPPVAHYPPPPAEPPEAPVRDLETARRPPYGCARQPGLIYRDPWLWPWRAAIVALRLDLGLPYSAIHRAMRELGIAPPPGDAAWTTARMREIVAWHPWLAHRARRAPFLTGRYEVREEPAWYLACA